ncbi:hypothetical protein [Streptomyces sp. NPDC048663]|uniref:hypothetical protein n=1 Tax=Streptomyces sp. NPDC048663 TaxID=3155638 RepID=UPI00344AEC1A
MTERLSARPAIAAAKNHKISSFCRGTSGFWLFINSGPLGSAATEDRGSFAQAQIMSPSVTAG